MFCSRVTTLKQHIRNLKSSMPALKKIFEKLPGNFETDYLIHLFYPIAYAHLLEQVTQVTNDNTLLELDPITLEEIEIQGNLTKQDLKEDLIKKYTSLENLRKGLSGFMRPLDDLIMNINEISPSYSCCCFFPKKSSSNEPILLSRDERKLLLLHVNAAKKIADNWYLNAKAFVAENGINTSNSYNPLINAAS